MTDRVALVTGCSSGIGEATARELASRGWQVAATARRPDELGDLAGHRGVLPLRLDVCDHDSVTSAVAETVQRLGPVEAVVNNAGYALLGAIEEVDLDAVRRQFETNLFGVIDVTQQVLPSMRDRRRGVIVNVSSIAGRFANPFGGVYAASKFAVEAISDALRLEVAPFGIKVVIVEPGPIATNFDARAHAESDPPDGSLPSPYQRWLDKMDEQADNLVGKIEKSPEACAAVIVDAIEARRPRARYRVTVPAHAIPVMQRLLPSAAFDSIMKRTLDLHRGA